MNFIQNVISLEEKLHVNSKAFSFVIDCLKKESVIDKTNVKSLYNTFIEKQIGNINKHTPNIIEHDIIQDDRSELVIKPIEKEFNNISNSLQENELFLITTNIQNESYKTLLKIKGNTIILCVIKDLQVTVIPFCIITCKLLSPRSEFDDNLNVFAASLSVSIKGFFPSVSDINVTALIMACLWQSYLYEKDFDKYLNLNYLNSQSIDKSKLDSILKSFKDPTDEEFLKPSAMKDFYKTLESLSKQEFPGTDEITKQLNNLSKTMLKPFEDWVINLFEKLVKNNTTKIKELINTNQEVKDVFLKIAGKPCLQYPKDHAFFKVGKVLESIGEYTKLRKENEVTKPFILHRLSNKKAYFFTGEETTPLRDSEDYRLAYRFKTKKEAEKMNENLKNIYAIGDTSIEAK